MTDQADVFFPAGEILFLSTGDRAFENERGRTESATLRIPTDKPYDVATAISKRCNELAAKHIDNPVVDTPNGKKLAYTRSVLQKGDDKTDPRCHGYLLIKANSKFEIKYYGSDNNELTPAQVASQLWPGQYAIFQIQLAWYEGKQSKGVTAYLKAIKVIGGGQKMEGTATGVSGEEIAKATPEELPSHIVPKTTTPSSQAGFGGTTASSAPQQPPEEEIPW